MFTLRIHSADPAHPVFERPSRSGAAASNASAAAAAAETLNPTIEERRGVVHLFRRISPNPCTAQLSTLLFVVAVPSQLSSDNFLRFCGSYIDHISEIVLIRNDAIEDQYSVLIRVADQKWASSFHRNFNGRPFSSTEAEVCHILFAESVEYTELLEHAATPPLGFTELPTCPVCLERLDQDTSGILATHCDHSFHCPCNSKWTDSSCLVCRLCQQQAERPTCVLCGASENLWICVICGFIGCGRYKERHAIQHWKDTQHCYSLDVKTQQVWDYVGDTYVHRLNQSKADGKLVDLNSSCGSLSDDCESCALGSESGISIAVLDSKVEAVGHSSIKLALLHLIARSFLLWMNTTDYLRASLRIRDKYPDNSYATINCQYYEKLILEAKCKREKAISEALEKACKLQDIQLKIEKCAEEKKVIANINENLVKNQEVFMTRLKEIEKRQSASIKDKDEKILDLEEQIRDIRVYVEAQRTVDNTIDADSVKGGTLLPVPSHQSSSPNSKRHSKNNNKRN
ncbi:hypothetical protein Syun_025766 [Stephania yunnanensis]|uniref:BRCA1-associated protein n=1 Tax=Stephania yunnanensis TaxID=152371 RepID=A0AAP0ESA6_9MAGN